MNQPVASEPTAPPQGSRRTLICVGGETDPWMVGFREYVESTGVTAFCYPLASSLTGAVSRVPFGVVVYDDGADKTPAKLKRIRECTRYLDVPIVAITHSSDRQNQSLLLAAGAHLQMTSKATHAEVLEAVAVRADIRPIMTEIQDNVLTPFIEMTMMTFREMARVELQTRASYQKKTYKMFGDISAVLGLFGNGSDGAMVLSFPRATAVAVTKCIFPDFPVDDDEEMVKDCVAELANIIAGQTKGRLAGTEHAFNISTPTVISGSEHVIQHKSGVPSLVVVFHAPLGEFALQICMSL